MFATKLLEIAKHSTKDKCVSQCSLPQASTSSSQLENEQSTTEQCAENAHAWTKQETLLLLELYREHQTKFVGGKGTVKKHWDNIAKLMQQKGYNIDGFKCSTKFQSLKRTYKCIVDHNQRSGNSRKDWEFLQVKPLATAGSHLGETENDINVQNKKENLPEKVSVTKKTEVNTLINDYILFSQEERAKRREDRAKQHEEKLLAFKKIENLLEKLVDKEK
ncbi:uncharacterized protein LOC118644810 [Monomorium pharaonis]|uniref:uncharacterized protein LOC118644810 n=1 Tax=Monomorium pharaonis TaxID=307658 RepID=UPI001747CF5D|nr:uncharacterized protein LOC118644810 [Monomorium pharaonis]XP_036140311.1 uncharacterized protein LOC118644810 [Monomorium pharaonis]